MTTLHMQTEQVSGVARQLGQTAQSIEVELAGLLGQVQSIPWVSPARDHFVSEIERLVQQARIQAEVGQELSLRVLREVEEWETAAATFGMDGGGSGGSLGGGVSDTRTMIERQFTGRDGYRIQSSTDEPPDNMKSLAQAVTRLYDTDPPQPIRVVEIGPGEYLVLITGTEGGLDSNNWNSALVSGAGLSSDYSELLKSVLLTLPTGAAVHMAGHSQGGIVANNVAVDKSVLDHLKLKSVTTFGSPVSAEEAMDEGLPVTYTRFAALGDPVPLLTKNAAVGVLVGNIVSPGLGGAVGGLAGGLWDQEVVPGSFNVRDAHFAYSNTDVLKDHALPFTITEWGDSAYRESIPASGSLPLIDRGL